jgi:hypothetical protein
MRLARLATTVAAALILFPVVSAPAPARAAPCPALPHVAWWDTSPEKIVAYVEVAYHGDWDRYIAKWQAYRNQMDAIYAHNGAAIVRSRDLRLEGDSLAQHIRDIDQRLLVTYCLKDHFGGRMAQTNAQLGAVQTQHPRVRPETKPAPSERGRYQRPSRIAGLV